MGVMTPDGCPNRSRTACFLAVNASYSHTSLAGGYLGALARAAGWQWHTIETLADADLPDLLARMAATRPSVLAATFYLFNRQRLLTIIRRFRALHPACIVIGGGPEFDGDNRAFLQSEPAIDLVIRGDGELAFAAWLARMDTPSRWREIPGVCRIASRGRYHDGGWATMEPDLDRLPSPYAMMPAMTGKPFVQLETSRGCSNRCRFCRGSGGGQVRFFSLPRVHRELDGLRAAGVREIRVLDRTFNSPAIRSRHLLRRLIGSFADVRFHLEIDPGRLTPAFLEILDTARPGQLHLEAGIQTLQAGAWRRVNRGGQPARALAGLRALTARPHLAVHADLIAGLPGVDRAALLADIRALMAAGPAELQLETLKLLPGTPLREQAAHEGIVFAPDPPYEVLRTREMSAADLAEAATWSRAIDWFYNTPPLQATMRDAMTQWPDFLERAAGVVRSHAPATRGAPSLRNRFLWLAGLVAAAPAWADRLRFEWMQHGLGECADFVCPRPWRGPIPETAEQVAGQPVAAGGGDDDDRRAVRRLLLRIGQDHIFEYRTGRDGRRQTTVYRLPDPSVLR